MKNSGHLTIYLTFAGILILYIGSYCYLSALGRYEPAFISFNTVRSYSWAPKGFVHNYQVDYLILPYLPLYYLDIMYWHQEVDAFAETKYPIDKISEKDIWKLYIAWGMAHLKTETTNQTPVKK